MCEECCEWNNKNGKFRDVFTGYPGSTPSSQANSPFNMQHNGENMRSENVFYHPQKSEKYQRIAEYFIHAFNSLRRTFICSQQTKNLGDPHVNKIEF